MAKSQLPDETQPHFGNPKTGRWRDKQPQERRQSRHGVTDADRAVLFALFNKRNESAWREVDGVKNYLLGVGNETEAAPDISRFESIVTALKKTGIIKGSYDAGVHRIALGESPEDGYGLQLQLSTEQHQAIAAYIAQELKKAHGQKK